MTPLILLTGSLLVVLLTLALVREMRIRRALERALRARGYRVEVAGDGVEALRRAEAFEPDLFLEDGSSLRAYGADARVVRIGLNVITPESNDLGVAVEEAAFAPTRAPARP